MVTGLQVIGAGVGRTGTNSLKLALETLLGRPCYHMFEAMERPGDFQVWLDAARGTPPDWGAFLTGFSATVDAPACHFWDALLACNPGAKVLLSRRDADSWYRSALNTIIEGTRRAREPVFVELEKALAELSGIDLLAGSEAELKRGFERHNQWVLASAPPEQLIVWEPGDGWGPICEGLGLAEPDEPFPHVNSTEDFRRVRLRQPD